MNKMLSDKNRRVLIIDDNRSIHDDFRKILSPATDKAAALDASEAAVFGNPTNSVKQTEFEVDSAYQGQEGVLLVRKARDAGLPYALAFVDVRMPPGWDGVETTRKIWELDPDLQIVLCTAYSDYSWDEMYEKLGQHDGLLILKKPFDAVEAFQLAHSLTEKWWLHQQSRQKMEELENRVVERTQELANSLSVLNATLESTADGIVAVDLSGKIVSYNTKFADTWHFPAGMLAHQDAAETRAHTAGQVKDSAKFLQQIKDMQDHPETETYDVIQLKDDRTFERYVFPQRIDSECVGTVINWRDITERKRAQEELQWKSAFLEAQVNSSIDGILVVDQNGKKVIQNQRTIDLFKIPQIIADGTDDAAQVRQVMGMAKNPEQFVKKVQYLYAHPDEISRDEIELKDGTVLDRYSSPVVGKDGKYYGRIWTFHDITERKLAENALRESNEKFHQLADNITDAFWIRSPDMSEVHYVSPAFEKIWGRSVESLYANPQQWSDFILPEDRERVRGAFAAITGEAPGLDIEYRIVRPDGEVRRIHVRSFQVRDAADTLIRHIGIVTDITMRERAQIDLAESEKRFRSIYESSPIGIANMGPTGKFLNCNNATEKLLGYSEQELKEMRFNDITFSEDRSIEYSAFNLMIEGSRDSLVVEKRYVRKDNQIVWARVTASAVRDEKKNLLQTVSIIEDITERKRSEDAIKESEQRFREMLENMELIAMTLDKNGAVTFANDYLLRLTGRTREEATGSDWFSTFHPKGEVKEKQVFLDSLAEGTIPAHDENLLVTKGGELRNIRWNNTVLRDAHGDINGTLSIGEDITEQKKLEGQVLRTQRLESIGTLASGVAHDLNNVLAPIMMSLHILRRQFPDSRSEKILNTLESSAQRGADIVKQVLTFAKGSEGERIALQPKHLLREIELIMQQTFPKYIHISSNISNALNIIKGNSTEIHQVLLNLCVNARDAMPDGGKLTIEAENITVGEQYGHMNIKAKPGGYVVFTVSDTGTGIPHGVMDKIFDPFFTTKEKGKGTGLGLSTVLGIMNSHFGFIDVYSEVNKGTKIKVYFPVEESLVVDKTKANEEMPQGRNELILVVDDEPLICEITKATLEANGYRVKVASDGTEAITIFIQHQKDVQLVLTDMSMPFMDGLSTIRALHRIAPQLKIIAVSGLAETIDNIKTSSLNVRASLIKPYSSQRLLMTIQAALTNE